MMQKDKLFANFSNEDGVIKMNYITDLDETVVKLLHLEDVMDHYDRCLHDKENPFSYTFEYYLLFETDYLNLSDTEKKKKNDELRDNWLSIYNEELKLRAQNLIKEKVEIIRNCSISIYERRERVTNYLNIVKPELMEVGCILNDGHIKMLGDAISDTIFDDILYLLADALCCRFQLNQYDGKYRNGMYHCLQYVNYKFRCTDFSKQYPNATPQKNNVFRKTKFLDIVTSRDNADFEIQGVKYKCSAYLEDGGLFRLKIEESVPWNSSNAPKNEFQIDCNEHTLWSVDKRYKVKLDATQMMYYIFFFENPDIKLEQMFGEKKEAFYGCMNRCNSRSTKFDDFVNKYNAAKNNSSKANKVIKDFEIKVKKRVSEINKKVCEVLGEAYSIKHKNGTYYIPISKDQIIRPND